MLIFNQLSKGKVRDFSLYIRTGEFICIYDSNPEIINLLFDLINGSQKAAAGFIRYALDGALDSEYTLQAPVSKMGLVYPDNILMKERTIEESFKFIMNIKGIDFKYFKKRIGRIMDIVDLSGLLQAKPSELLPHQLLRANIAQAILNYPPLLLLKAPTEKLDDVNARGILRLLNMLNNLSMTIILLTTDARIIKNSNLRVVKLDAKESKRKGLYG